MFVSIDLETTGFDPEKNEIIEIAAVRFDEQKIIDTFDILVKPKSELSLEIKRLTGLKDEDFQNAPLLQKALLPFKNFIGKYPLIGHNILFDLQFLEPHFGKLENECFDTLEFSRVLFFSEKSYALDQMVKRFSLPHEQSHRALPDAKATALLFQYLLREAKSTPPKIFETLTRIFEKTNWPYKKFFKVGVPRKTKKNQTSSHASFGSPSFAQECLQANRALIETPDFPDLHTLQKSGESMLLSYGRFREAFENFPTLHQQDHYFSPEKFEKYIERENHFENQEAAFLVKLALFEATTETGLRHEVSLHSPEWNFWPLVAGEGSFFMKAQRKAHENSLILCPHASLPFINLHEKKKLIVSDSLLLEDNLTFALEKRFSLERFDALLKNSPELHAKIQILFGLLGMYFESHRTPTDYHDILVGDAFPSSREGKLIVESVRNLETSSLDPFTRSFCETLQSDDPLFPRWLSSYEHGVMLHQAPLRPTLEKDSVIFFDTALSLDSDFSFFKNLFSLHQVETKHFPNKAFANLKLEIPEHLPEPNSEGYFKRCSEIIEETMEEFLGGVVVLFHTKKALEAHFEKIIEQPVAQKVRLFAVGKTGGMGKVIDQFLEEPEKSVLFGTAAILPHLEKFYSALRAVIFQKIPFEFSYHPLTKLRQKQFSDGFTKYTLPKALLRLKRFLAEFASFPGKRKLIFLDPRILKHEYSALRSELNQYKIGT